MLGAIGGLLAQTALNMWRHKLRSFLTMFGIAWGIASLVLMSALCDGFRDGWRKNMGQIGDQIVMVWGGRTEIPSAGQPAGRRIRLYEKDVEVVRTQCPLVSVAAGELKRYGTPAVSNYNSGRFLVLGVTPEYLQLRNLPVASGRQIRQEDEQQQRRVAVLGHSVRKQLFPDGRDPVGQQVRLGQNGVPYLVVGLMGDKNQNSSYDGWDNEKVLISLGCLRRDMPPERSDYRAGSIDTLIYRPVSAAQWEEAQQQVRRLMGRLHNFDPADEAALPMWDTVETAKLYATVFDATEIFLAVISLVTLTLGGVGVMNTMMMAVAERTNEIGLRKAIGATRSRIMTDFFLEGVMLACLSGLAGLTLTWLMTSAVNSLPMPVMFAGLPMDFRTVLTAAGSLGTVAIISALPPAWRAAQLTPVEALRFER
jgi:putative ABC transport system permease protein